MKEANFDTTYCTSTECKEKCWRHVENYHFQKNKNYWYSKECIEKKKTGDLKDEEML